MTTQDIKANHSYFMGSSSSPKFTIVLSVDEHAVTVVEPYGETMKRFRLDRKSAMMSAAKGGRTVAEQASKTPEPFKADALARAALHGASANPRNWNLYEATLRPVSGEWDSTENWRAAQNYGNTSGDCVKKLLDVTRVQGSRLKTLVSDENFVVVSIVLSEECGVGV
jgi:hypothetical protein